MGLHTILVVDDDAINRDILHDMLFAHFRVVTADNAHAALEAVGKYKPSLTLLDMNMPKIDGIELCKKIRALKDVGTMPIIMVSGEGNEESRTKAFLSGVDDFISKPVSGQELVARILSKLSWDRKFVSKNQEILTLGNLSVDDRRRSVSLEGSPLRLTQFEYILLKYFIENQDQVLSRAQILEDVWQTSNVTNRTIDTHIYSLRQKLDKFEYEFCTVHGSGYILRRKSPSNLSN